MVNASNSVLAAASLIFMFQSSDWPQARGAERHILLTNNTRQPIVEVYISDPGAGNWQADLLGSDFLAPGQSVFVDIDDRNGRCWADVKTVLDDGSDFVARHVNLCRSEGDAVSLQ